MLAEADVGDDTPLPEQEDVVPSPGKILPSGNTSSPVGNPDGIRSCIKNPDTLSGSNKSSPLVKEPIAKGSSRVIITKGESIFIWASVSILPVNWSYLFGSVRHWSSQAVCLSLHVINIPSIVVKKPVKCPEPSGDAPKSVGVSSCGKDDVTLSGNGSLFLCPFQFSIYASILCFLIFQSLP